MASARQLKWSLGGSSSERPVSRSRMSTEVSVAGGSTVSMTGPNFPLGPVNAVFLGSVAVAPTPAPDSARHLRWWKTDGAKASSAVFRTIAATKYFFRFIMFASVHKATFCERKDQRVTGFEFRVAPIAIRNNDPKAR